jgi:hypothetical protein
MREAKDTSKSQAGSKVAEHDDTVTNLQSKISSSPAKQNQFFPTVYLGSNKKVRFLVEGCLVYIPKRSSSSRFLIV